MSDSSVYIVLIDAFERAWSLSCVALAMSLVFSILIMAFGSHHGGRIKGSIDSIDSHM
jgi:hypothetical protein